MFEKEKIEESLENSGKRETGIFKNQTGRYKIYFDKKLTQKHPELLSEEEVDSGVKYILNAEEIIPEVRQNNLMTPKIEKKIEERKKWIEKFGNKIGLSSLKDRLTKNENIYIVASKIFNKQQETTRETTAIQRKNNVVIRKGNIDSVLGDAQHELLHSVSLEVIYLQKIGQKGEYESTRIGYGNPNIHESANAGYNYNKQKDGNLICFNEGLTEITNLQISFENKVYKPSISYIEIVIFVAEFIKDITNKIKEKSKETEKENSKEKIREFIESIPQKLNGEKRELTKEELKNIAENLTEEEVLAHFQRGMFESNRQNLKIITDYYGPEALDALITMKNRKNSVVKTANIFSPNLGNVVKAKIDSLDMGIKIKLDSNKIGEYKAIGNKNE